MTDFFIAVDGGGTGCRALVADASGNILGQGESGPANISTDRAQATDNVLAAIASAFAKAGLSQQHYKNSHAVLGLAGGNIARSTHNLSQAFPFAHTDIESDAVTALQGALGDEDGCVAILGTGSAYILREKENLQTFGGWGFAVSDLGSGARIGQSLLQETLLAYDGVGTLSALGRHVLQHFDNKADNIVNFTKNARPSDYGAFAPLVFRFAHREDTMACSILTTAAANVADMLAMVLRRGAERLCLLGGLAPLYPPLLPPEITAHLVPAKNDAVNGALQLAIARYRTIL